MRLAIIGLGMAARAHVAALEALHDRVQLTGLYTRNKISRESAAEAMQIRAFSSLEEIARDPETEAVLVLTPPKARREIIATMAEAGKHILLEKPLDKGLVAAIENVEIAKKGGVLLGTVLQHRVRPGSKRLAEMLRNGDLGKIGMVRTEVPWWRGQDYYDQPGRGTYEQDGGGVLLTQAIHVMDLMLSLCGPVRSVQAMLGTTSLHEMEAEDFATAGLVYENGALGSICATTAAFPGASEVISIDGTLGSARLEGGHLTIHWRDGSVDEFAEKGSSGGGADPMAFPYDWHMGIIENFADAIEGKAPLVASGEEALAVHRLIEGMIQSSNKNGERVDLASL